MSFDFGSVKIDGEVVLKAIDCYKDSPVYNTVLNTFDEVSPVFGQLIQPSAAYSFCENILDDYTYTVLVIYTLGEEVSLMSSRFFDEGSYMKGLLTDAMADYYLMQMDFIVSNEIKKECARRGLGLTCCFIPAETIDIRYQKIIVDMFPEFNVSVTGSLMLSPVKSMTKMFGADKKLKTINQEHCCDLCSLKACKWRRIS